MGCGEGHGGSVDRRGNAAGHSCGGRGFFSDRERRERTHSAANRLSALVDDGLRLLPIFGRSVVVQQAQCGGLHDLKARIAQVDLNLAGVDGSGSDVIPTKSADPRQAALRIATRPEEELVGAA
jgi:hypothetical protein